jgi:hypothetical protein
MLDSLTEGQKFALAALLEVQPPTTVGEFVSETDEGDFVTTYRFATTMSGYPGWVWTVSVADLPDEHPTVVESELLPADGALLAPDWVPWSERMEDYRAAQAALGEQAAAELDGDADDDDLDDDDDDDDDLDDDDDDEDDLLGSDTLHGGDLDGVDIDELADPDADDDLDDLTPEAEEVIEAEVLDVEPVEAPKKPVRRRRASSKPPTD